MIGEKDDTELDVEKEDGDDKDPFKEEDEEANAALDESSEGFGATDETSDPPLPRGEHVLTIEHAMHTKPSEKGLLMADKDGITGREKYTFQRRTMVKFSTRYTDPTTSEERKRVFTHDFYTFIPMNKVPGAKSENENWVEWALGQERLTNQLIEAIGLEKGEKQSLFAAGKDLEILQGRTLKAYIGKHEDDAFTGDKRERIARISRAEAQ